MAVHPGHLHVEHNHLDPTGSESGDGLLGVRGGFDDEGVIFGLITAVRADGGRFDQLTGASVTPRAVVKAIRETLLYFDAHQAEIFDMPATADSQ